MPPGIMVPEHGQPIHLQQQQQQQQQQQHSGALPPSTGPAQAASITHSAHGQHAPPSVMSAPAAGWQGGGGNTVDTAGRRDSGLPGGPLSVWSATESFRQGAMPGSWQGMPGWGPGGQAQQPHAPSHLFAANGSVHGGSVHGSIHSMPHHLMQGGGWQGMYPGPMAPGGGGGPPQWQQAAFQPSMAMQGQYMNGNTPNNQGPSTGLSVTMTAPMHFQPQHGGGLAGGRPPIAGGVRQLEPPQAGGMEPTQGAAKRSRPSDT